jgi:hypothetical protein
MEEAAKYDFIVTVAFAKEDADAVIADTVLVDSCEY